MTILECEQGSREWIEARLGIPTASQFSRILTPGRLTLSAQRVKYIGELLWEWTSGEPYGGELDTEWTRRGHDLEPRAREYYGVVRDVRPTTVGLCVRDIDLALALDSAESKSIGGRVGASPDSLVGDPGLLETKCPAPATHIVWLSAGADVLPGEHRMQVQGQLWVTGRAWCDFMSFCPGLPPLLVRVEPDPEVQTALDDALPAFCAELAERREWLRGLGVQSWKDQHDELVEQQKTPMTYDEAKGEWVPWDGKQAEHERIMAEHDREEATLEHSD